MYFLTQKMAHITVLNESRTRYFKFNQNNLLDLHRFVDLLAVDFCKLPFPLLMLAIV